MNKLKYFMIACASVLAFNVTAADDLLVHKNAGLTCVSCHETKTPSKAADYKKCISCHKNGDGAYFYGPLNDKGEGKLFSYQENGKTRMASFHDAHVGHLRCTLCHSIHKDSNSKEVYCNKCHQFEVKIK